LQCLLFFPVCTIQEQFCFSCKGKATDLKWSFSFPRELWRGCCNGASISKGHPGFGSVHMVPMACMWLAGIWGPDYTNDPLSGPITIICPTGWYQEFQTVRMPCGMRTVTFLVDYQCSAPLWMFPTRLLVGISFYCPLLGCSVISNGAWCPIRWAGAIHLGWGRGEAVESTWSTFM
jgi:hypothetical protein